MNNAVALAVPDARALSDFIEALRRCFADGVAHVAEDIPRLLDALRDQPFDTGVPARERELLFVADAVALTPLLETFRAPLEAVEASGMMGNPWAAAALARVELRNASVLRWFLDPRGSHGCGNALLVELLGRVGRHLPGEFPVYPSAQCSVSAEECPEGDRVSRVDIQIDDPNFYIVIEVKIDAPEQPKQVKRYGDAAAARTLGRRPWAVVFLTSDGRLPTTAGDRSSHVVPISWNYMAAALRRVGRASSDVPRFLATSFATHIANF